MTEIYLTGILLAFGAFGLGMLSPGPNILAVIGTSMSTDRKAGMALALGIGSGSLLWGMMTLFGLTSLIALYASLMTGIKIAGSLYLLWLGIKSFRSALSAVPITVRGVTGQRSAFGYFRRGLLIQMTNPKAALTWIAVMSLAMGANTPFWVGAAVVTGTTAISMFGHLGYALAFSTTPMVAAYGKARRWIDGGLGCFFCFASYKLITSRT
ncbi:LysE family transporter [Nisaea sp.]|uniref:LysE family translocator n=1 Tax=Nisaea sp. TaxID=2024842 RepID=UPI003267422B